jgi:hypothetical protein
VTTANIKRLLLFFILIITLLHWASLFFHYPLYSSESGWFWLFFDKPRGSAASLALLAVLSTALLFIARHRPELGQRVLLLLIFLGAGLQINFALLEGRGIDAVRDRIITTGHSEFAKLAVQQGSIPYVLQHYEDLISSGELGLFPRSKAPGTLFTYLLTKEIGTLGAPELIKRNKALQLERLRTTATYLWPILSYLVLIPIFYLSTLLAGSNATAAKEAGLLACALFLTVPSVNLMILHTDQTFYPLLFTLPIVVAVAAAKRSSSLLMFLAGALVYFAIWFSFALIFSVVLALGLSFFVLLQYSKFNIKQHARFYFAFPLGFLALHGLFLVLFNYDFLTRYENATQFHFSVKGWDGGLALTLHFGLLNIMEFFVWLGAPIVLLILFGFLQFSSHSLTKRTITIEHALPILTVFILVLIALIGKTKAETARLWLFLVPICCVAAAQYLIYKFGNNAKTVIPLVLVLQLGTTYLTKTNQDFF